MTFSLKILVLLFLVVIGLSGCRKSVLKTPEGIPRKLVVRKDNTTLYDSDKLNRNYAKAKQWQIFYMFGEFDDCYMVSGEIQRLPESPYYIKKSDVFEWNSYFCLTYRNSPHKASRPRAKTYKTLEGCRHYKGELAFIEKERHRSDFVPTDAKPILEEWDNSIYHVASLYDNVNERGEYVFLGNYDFGYVRYSEYAHEFRRYVSKKQLDKQILHVLGARRLVKPNMNPSELDKLYGPLSDLLADFGNNIQKGVKDILSIFRSKDVPSEAQRDIFAPEFLRGKNTWKIDPQLHDMANGMISHLKKTSNWNEDGYSYVPAEWIGGSK